MNHLYVLNNNVVEKYLLHDLARLDETRFEEHLLYCDDCNNEIERLKVTIKVLTTAFNEQDNIIPEGFNQASIAPHRKMYLFLKIAGSFLLLSTIGSITYLLFFKTIEHTLPPSVGNNIAVIAADSGSKITKASDEKDLVSAKKIVIAEVFIPNPIIENEIQNRSRSNTIHSVNPADTISAGFGDIINFSWESSIADSLVFLILDNTGKEKKSVPVINKFTFKVNLSPGIYYWQLQTKTELLFTGKFRVNSR